MIGDEQAHRCDAEGVSEDKCAATEATPAATASDDTEIPSEKPPPAAVPQIEEVHDLNWDDVSNAVLQSSKRSQIRATVESFEALLDREGGAELLFDRYRANPGDQAIVVPELDPAAPLWIIGDLHGDVLALETALALINSSAFDAASPPNIIFLGDLFDDEGLGLELLLRVFQLILALSTLR